MVPIENKYRYLEDLKTNALLVPVIDFIFFSNVAIINSDLDLNNPQDVTKYLIIAIDESNEQAFLTCYDAYKKKAPDERSPWIYNNYLLFFFILATYKFDKELGWLKAAISKRKRGLDEEEDMISDFFYNIVHGHLQGRAKYAPLNLSFKFLLNNISVNNEDVSSCLKELNSSPTFPFYGNVFLNVLYLKSFDICLELKDIKDLRLEERYNAFEFRFLKRINILSNVLVYIILIGVIIVLYRVLMQVEEQKRNIITTILGIVGITALEVFKLRSPIGTVLKKALQGFFGYRPENKN